MSSCWYENFVQIPRLKWCQGQECAPRETTWGTPKNDPRNLSFIVLRDRNQLIFDGSFHSFPIFRRVQLLQDVAIADHPRTPTWPTLPRQAAPTPALPRQVGRASRCDMGPGDLGLKNHHGCSDSRPLEDETAWGEVLLWGMRLVRWVWVLFSTNLSRFVWREVPLQRLIIIFPPKNCTSLEIYRLCLHCWWKLFPIGPTLNPLIN